MTTKDENKVEIVIDQCSHTWSTLCNNCATKLGFNISKRGIVSVHNSPNCDHCKTKFYYPHYNKIGYYKIYNYLLSDVRMASGDKKGVGVAVAKIDSDNLRFCTTDYTDKILSQYGYKTTLSAKTSQELVEKITEFYNKIIGHLSDDYDYENVRWHWISPLYSTFYSPNSLYALCS